MDALIVNRLCGYKLIKSGSQPKAGVPLSNESIFNRLEQESISYVIFKKDFGVQRKFDASGNLYAKMGDIINKELEANGKSVEQYFPKETSMVTSRAKICELGVITKVKELVSYIMDVTEKAPKQFRVVFVNRMQNLALDVMEFMVEANFSNIQTESDQRKRLQKHAFVKLKVLANICYIAMKSQAIKKTHYLNISRLVEETSAMLVAWGKSDERRFKQIA